MDALFLVVPDTKYNKTCPVLIGTNILQTVIQMANANTLNQLSIPWKIISKNINSAALQAKMTNPIIVRPGETVHVTALVHTAGIGATSCVICEPDVLQPLPGGLTLTPVMMTISNKTTTSRINVLVQNISARCVTLPKRHNLCSVHTVDFLPTDSASAAATTDSIDPEITEGLCLDVCRRINRHK